MFRIKIEKNLVNPVGKVLPQAAKFMHIEAKLFPRRRPKKVAPAGRLSMPKLELKMLNPDKPEITNYKHQMTNKFQILISKSQIRSKTNCLEF
jgi:hypothetical protein